MTLWPSKSGGPVVAINVGSHSSLLGECCKFTSGCSLYSPLLRFIKSMESDGQSEIPTAPPPWDPGDPLECPLVSDTFVTFYLGVWHDQAPSGLGLPWVRKIPWRRKWQPTPVFLPGKSHGQDSLVVYSPWCHTELDTTERLRLIASPHFHHSLFCSPYEIHSFVSPWELCFHLSRT